MAMGMRSRVELLDRPGTRWILSLLASARASARQGHPTVIRPWRGAWLHDFGATSFLHSRIRTYPPAWWAERTHDIFFCHYTPKAGDVVLEVGSGVGTETVTLARLVGSSGRVVAIEAHPTTFRLLDGTVQLNRLTNTVCMNLAVGEKADLVRITDEADRHHGNRILATVEDTQRAIFVPQLSMDSIVTGALQLGRIDLLKMNIEGSELPALSSARDTLSITRSAVIACHDFKATRIGEPSLATRKGVIEILTAEGFSVAPRRKDKRPWVEDMVYASKTAVDAKAELEQLI